MLSIIVPAHNEEDVIAGCLEALTRGAAAGELEVIVACNGCTDRTAEIARGFGSPVRVVEISTPSKIAALNAADREARGFPRFYIDADVILDLNSVRLMAEVLEQGQTLAATPEADLDLSQASWAVRAFHKVWTQLPYNRGHGQVGTGVYALSREGRSRFGEFPNIINDDGFVRFQFSSGERKTVPGAVSRVVPPRDLGTLIRVKTRVRVGNYQLRERYPDMVVSEARADRSLARFILGRPDLWAYLPLYAGVVLFVRWQAKRRMGTAREKLWERDRAMPARPVPNACHKTCAGSRQA